jgi:integrase
MATVKYRVVGKTKKPSQILLRYSNGRDNVVQSAIGISIVPEYFDKDAGKVRKVLQVPSHAEINKRLMELEVFVIDKANIDFMLGQVIDKNWLETKIAEFFNRPAKVLNNSIPDPYKVYLCEFGEWWLKEKAPTYKISKNKYLSERSISQYKSSCLEIIKRYEAKHKKIMLRDINEALLDSFSSFLTQEKYAEATIEKVITRFKFFCSKAEEAGFEVNKGYKSRVFVESTEEDYIEPYLNESEIDALYKLNLNNSPGLDAIRDNWIIGLWTGLRVSDFLQKLDIKNFDPNGKFIHLKTTKTSAKVAIPVHWMIKEILKKRNGQLPPKVSDVEFNRKIKEIGRKMKMFQEMEGGVMVTEKDKETGKSVKRKVRGIYPKWRLLTSHICRRSFATNHYRKIDDDALMAICGWASREQMLEYIQKTNLEHAEALQKLWEGDMLKVV